MTRVTNADVARRVLTKVSRRDVTINDIENAYCELRSERAFGASVRGGNLLNGLRPERIKAIEDEISRIYCEYLDEALAEIREARAGQKLKATIEDAPARGTIKIALTRDEARALAATLGDWSVDLSADLAEKLRARIAGELSRC